MDSVVNFLFIDLDGTVRKPLGKGPFIQFPADQELIDGVAEKLQAYKDKNYIIMGITNQGGCEAVNPKTGRPYKSQGDLWAEMDYTLKLAPMMTKIYCCPNLKTEESHTLLIIDRQLSGDSMNHRILCEPQKLFRKPEPGMIHYGADVHTTHMLKAGESVGKALVVGDRPEDQEAATAANMPFLWADEWLLSGVF